MLVLNDPAAQISSVEGAVTAAPVAKLSAFASSNDIVVKVRCFCEEQRGAGVLGFRFCLGSVYSVQ